MADTPQRRRRWVMPLLFTSLAANLLIAGMAVGWALSDGRKDRPQGPIRGVLGEPFVRALPQESRRAIVSDLTEQRSRFRESRESLRQRFENFLEVLNTDPFDIEEAKRLLSEQRRIGIERQEFGETLLLNRLSEMSVDERRAYAERLQEALPRLKRR